MFILLDHFSTQRAYFIYNMACTKEDAEKLVPGTKLLVGMDGNTVQTGDTSTFFAEQIKKNNANTQNTKITKYGIGTYSVVGMVDIVVMVAQ